MKTLYFFYAIVAIVLLVATFGFIGPALISAKDNVLVLSGVTICIAVPFSIIVSINKLIQKEKREEKSVE